MGKESTAQANASKKTTGRGRNVKWSLEDLKIEANKYTFRGEFREGSAGAYMRATRIGALDDICSHMKKKKPGYSIWNKENIKTEAMKFNSRTEFSKGSAGAYGAAYRMGILDRVCSHMNYCGRKWDFESSIKEAMKYNLKQDFTKGSSGAYSACLKNGWIDIATSHMKKVNRKSDKVYIWEVLSPLSSDVYKVGVSSSNRRIGYRSSSVSRSLGVSVGKQREFLIGESKAESVERSILNGFPRCNLFSGEGSTEIIHLSKSEYINIINHLIDLSCEESHRKNMEQLL